MQEPRSAARGQRLALGNTGAPVPHPGVPSARVERKLAELGSKEPLRGLVKGNRHFHKRPPPQASPAQGTV